MGRSVSLGFMKCASLEVRHSAQTSNVVKLPRSLHLSEVLHGGRHSVSSPLLVSFVYIDRRIEESYNTDHYPRMPSMFAYRSFVLTCKLYT